MDGKDYFYIAIIVIILGLAIFFEHQDSDHDLTVEKTIIEEVYDSNLKIKESLNEAERAIREIYDVEDRNARSLAEDAMGNVIQAQENLISVDKISEIFQYGEE